MVRDIDDYFAKGCGRCGRFATADCSTRAWAPGLAELRRICLAAGLVETVKWGQPCYMHAGRNIVILGALRGDFRISFFDAALLRDPEQVLEKQGPNTRHADAIRFTDNLQVAAREEVLTAYLREAMRNAAAGKRVPKQPHALELPAELITALDADAELATAFRSLTPGRQRSYVIALASAKAAATRVARIAKFRSRILAGKGAQER
ncbi:MAG: YdeI/OmpD-associated family protein [Planctomycetes bacterium]|nr:YdeI/OmpD-associated family protein [Planctomycetota bacterium]